jgi:mono/diheme cytochrome c family protein
MTGMLRGSIVPILFVLGALGGLPLDAGAQHAGHGASAPVSPARRVTMEELHRSGGVPRGWKFTLPAGDPAKGRQVFADLECSKCHAIKGEGFPPSGGDAKNVGPELTGMGSHHPAEYFAESILAPNAVILDGPGYTGGDGTSIMPSYADSLSVTQLLDLVAYLKSLTDGEGGHHHSVATEQAAGDYTVRLAYASGAGGHAMHGMPGMPAMKSGGTAGTPGHLAVFVTDRGSGEPVPYLPVTATLHAQDTKPLNVRLAPMVDAQGFHYGANVTIPDATAKVTVSIGKPTMQIMPSAKGRFAKPVRLEFEWEGP